jgi:hypothetical protein
MCEKEILKLDFYDFCGVSSVLMTDEEKIKYYRTLDISQQANLIKTNNVK